MLPALLGRGAWGLVGTELELGVTRPCSCRLSAELARVPAPAPTPAPALSVTLPDLLPLAALDLLPAPRRLGLLLGRRCSATAANMDMATLTTLPPPFFPLDNGDCVRDDDEDEDENELFAGARPPPTAPGRGEISDDGRAKP